MKAIRYYLLVVLASYSLCHPEKATAQALNPDELGIKASAAYTATDTVVVRWAPINFKSWELGNANGYHIERFTMAIEGNLLSPQEYYDSRVDYGDLLPGSEDFWKELSETNNYAGVAAGAIFGENFTVADIANNNAMTIYNINQEKENRYGLSLFAADVDFTTALALRLAFVDDQAHSDYRYHYRITMLGVPAGENAIPGDAILETNAIINLPPPVDLQTEAGDKVIRLNWDNDEVIEYYTCFNVERSSDGGITFGKVNDEPIIFTNSEGEAGSRVFYADSLDNNTTTYVFRVKGISPFGVTGPPSDTVQVKGKPNPVSGNLYIMGISELNLGKMKVDWEFPSQLNNEIQGFNLYKSKSREGEYTKVNSTLIAAGARTYEDASPFPINYYRIELLDVNDYALESFPALGQLNDETPPAAPQEVTGEAEGTSGQIVLNWQANTDEDLMGYRVYISDQPEGEYIQVTTTWIKEPSFVHTVGLNTISEYVYYKIRAIDFRENTSAFSTVCTVKLPDLIAPSAPVLKKAEPLMTGVLLEWSPSRSKDVVLHVIERKAKTAATWELVADFTDPGVNTFLDTTITEMVTYDYRAMAFDDGGLNTSSKIFRVKPIGSGLRQGVENLHAVFQKPENAVKLTWEYNNAYGVASFNIYRGFGPDFNMVEIASVLPQQAMAGGVFHGPSPTLDPQGTGGTIDAGQGPSQGNAGGGNSQINNGIYLDLTGNSAMHYIQYKYMDKEINKGKTIRYQVIVKFIDGTSSVMSTPDETISY